MKENNILRKGKILIENPWRIFYRFNYCKLSHFLSDKQLLKLLFRARIGKKLNLDNPKTFNEKLQWLKVYDRKPLYTKLVDKYDVRDFVKEKIGEEYLVPLLGVWNSFDAIEFSKLPSRFVLKCTHDSGSVVLCHDKDTFDVVSAEKKLTKALNHNFYYIGREWPYKDAIPRIVAEKMLLEKENEELIDYKFMCFNGKAKCCFICTDRFSDSGLKVTFYDRDWNIMPIERMYPREHTPTPKPKSYDLMVQLAEMLASDLPFARIDFYEVNGKPYFGEITLFPGSGMKGFSPEEWDRIMGNWIVLPEKKR